MTSFIRWLLHNTWPPILFLYAYFTPTTPILMTFASGFYWFIIAIGVIIFFLPLKYKAKIAAQNLIQNGTFTNHKEIDLIYDACITGMFFATGFYYLAVCYLIVPYTSQKIINIEIYLYNKIKD